MNIEGILGVGGFWLCMILLIFRGAIRERLVNAPQKTNTPEISEMKARLITLEARVTAMSGEIMELQDGQDFDRKLLGKTEKKSSSTLAGPRVITASPVSAGRSGLPLK